MKKTCTCKSKACKHVQEELELRRAAQKKAGHKAALTGQVRVK